MTLAVQRGILDHFNPFLSCNVGPTGPMCVCPSSPRLPSSPPALLAGPCMGMMEGEADG